MNHLPIRPRSVIGIFAAFAALAMVSVAVATSYSGRAAESTTGSALLRREADLARTNASVEQQSVLADGVVSDAEYDSAIGQAASCLQAAGVTPEVQPRVGKKAPGIGFSAPSIEAGETARLKLVACEDRYLSAVRIVYLAQSAPSEADLQLWRRTLGDCMVLKGIPVEDGPISNDQLLKWRHDQDLSAGTVLGECMLESRENLGY